MVNDINTLNGSLQALGEKMASNLTTMGVPSTYDEGLNTLADKILQVAPVKTLDHINVELIAGNQILSYADEQKIPDSQYATVRFTAYDVDNNVIPNLALDFKVGSGAVTSVVTDANGGYEYTYHSLGVGDVEITASKTVEGSLVTETYGIEDCTFYHSSAYTTSDIGSATYPIGVDLPSTYELSFIFHPTDRQTSGGGNSAYIKLGQTDNDIWVGQGTTSGSHGIMVRPSSNHWCSTISQIADNLAKLTYNGTNLTYECNNETVSVTPSSSSLINRLRSVVVVPKNPIKEIKVKPL